MGIMVDDEAALFDFVVKKGNGIKGLVDTGISEVPKLYIHPENERILKTDVNSSSKVQQFASVPIDLSKLGGPDHDEVAAAIVQASETLGFFQVINHGATVEELEAVKGAAHRFFGQPAEDKAVYLRATSISPFVKYNTSFAPDKEKSLEWKDLLHMIYINEAVAREHWPKEVKEEALDYLKVTSNVAKKLFEVLMKNLGAEVDESMLKSLTGSKMVNMNYYPPCPNPDLTIGVGRHSDIGTLTVLLQDGIGGLYVKVEENVENEVKEEWVEIPPIPGALVINIGDSLQILSNGRYKSAEHRVRTTSKQSRVSIPYFASPLLTGKIGPLPELVKRDGKAVYKEVVFQEYMMNFFGKAHHGKHSNLDFAKLNLKDTE